MMPRTFRFFLLLLILLPLSLAAALLFGSEFLAPAQFFDAEGNADPVLWLRLTRWCTAMGVGGALALSGAVFQAVLRNVLAEPFILGVSGGAALGAALAFVLGFAAMTVYAVPLCAMAGGLAALAAVLLLGAGKRGPESLLLSGVIVGTVSSSLLMCVISFAGTDEMCSITWWMLGDLSSTDPALLAMLWISIPVLGSYLCLMAPKANALSLGPDYAWSMGVHPVRTSFLLIGAASLLAAQSVAAAGIISFAGLIIPHIVRRLLSADNRRLFPASFLAGGVFLVLCDVLSRSVHPARELQIGVITALAGGPFFLWLLRSGSGETFCSGRDKA